MSSAEVDSTPSKSTHEELCKLLQCVRRGEVIHPHLKELLVHLGFAEYRFLALALTDKGRQLVGP
ncbi:MAG: hypothetical protein CTR55_04130 [Pseudomonas sp.]|uniref:hypothetical protein n=1 Tax=Pseudomonas sp. TaxID=306 RepID=UPI000CA8DEA2|nr:hypothetical protein [Pseudomonas sp.]PJI50530.1 MAG: hypothetical protein CTR55_04130 [Pseudomonas sp.]